MTLRLYLLAPTTVFAASVNQASFTYPIDQVTFDTVTTGAFGDIQVGQTVYFGGSAGASNRGRQRIRKAATSSILYFGRSSNGFGDGEVNFFDDTNITVVDDFRVWNKTPFIDISGTTATVKKDSDLTYTDQTDEPPPVANCGPGVAATIDGSNIITVDFDASTNSYAVADGATISTYLWDVDDGTITVGTSASAAITATFPAGFRWVSLTVTDDNGKTHTARCPVFARDPASDDTISAFTIERHRITAFGQELSVRVLEDIDEDTYPDGTLVMLWEDEPASAADRSHMLFIGWHRTDPANLRAERTGYLRDTTLHCLDVAGRLKEIHGYPQEVQNDATPANWGEMSTLNIDKYIHYLLQWHSTALDLADFTDSGLGATMAAYSLASDPGSLYEQANEMATFMTPDHYLTCNRNGQLQVIVDPMLAESGVDRTSTVQATLIEDDWTEITWTHQRPPRLYWLWGGAIKASNNLNSDGELDTFFCVAPGNAPGIGTQELRHERGLAATQGKLNIVTGHRYARANAPNSHFRVVFADSDDRGIEPADMTWVQLTLGSVVSAAQRGLTLAGNRMLPHELNIRYNHERTGLTKTIELICENEIGAVGTAALSYTPDRNDSEPNEGDWWPDDYWDDNSGGIVQPIANEINIPAGVQELAIFDHTGHVYTTSDFQTLDASGGPTWTDTDLVITEEIYDFVVDPFSPGYRGTGTTVNGWLVSENAIYRITDIFGTPAKATQHTFGTQADVAGAFRTIEASFGRFFPDETTNPWLVCVSHYADKAGHTGTWAIYSQDAGVTWSTEVQLTAHYPTAGLGTYEEIAVYASPRTPGYALTQAYTETDTDPGVAVYETTDWGENWSVSSVNLSPGNRISSCIQVPYHNNPDEDLIFSANTKRLSPLQHALRRLKNGGNVDISPDDGTRDYGTGRKWGIRASDVNQDKLVLAGRGNDTTASTSGDRFGVWTSENGGDTWVERVAPSTATQTPRSATFLAGSETEIVIFGRNMYIRYSDDFGANFDDRSGSGLPTVGNYWLRGICGGLS